jgi:peptidoglycan/xylan/chitin deacetylase (PgdA/CDA1 family)
MYLHKTPAFMGKIFPDVLWKKQTNANEIFLTFDDGPVPEVTEWVLEELEKHSITATFFMVGNNVIRYDNIYSRVIRSGHSVGNHSYNHLNGWKTNTDEYVDNINRCEDLLNTPTRFFRPPHGRMQWQQYIKIKQTYKIVMWDVLSGDFDQSNLPEKSLRASISTTTSGSIIVFHDSLKSSKKLKYILPRYLDHFGSKGYLFKSL